MILKFKGKYFDDNSNAVHVDDKDVQRMIDEVVEKLVESKEESDFRFQATGDTLVAGLKCEEEIEIMVTQNYSHACLLKDKYDNYEPIDWGNERYWIYQDMSKDELIEEIMKLKSEYDPRREV